MRINALGPQYETCNVVYPREMLAALGGFDESFGSEPAGEDADLAWRALAAGHTAMFAPEAIVHHALSCSAPTMRCGGLEAGGGRRRSGAARRGAVPGRP